MPEDRYRPLHLGKTAARVAGWSLPLAGGVLGVMAAQSGSAWAGLAVGAPVGLTAGLVVGGLADIMKSLGGGSSRGVGRATVVGTLIGGAITGGLSAWLVASGSGWGVPVMAAVGALQGVALGAGVHFLTRSEPTECQRLVRQINEDPQKYDAPRATPYLDALHSLEKGGWRVDGQGLLNYQLQPDPAVTVSLARKGERENELPVEQLPAFMKILRGEQSGLPRPELLETLADKPLISQARAADLPYGGVPGPEAEGWWQVERTRAYHDLCEGKALHYAHREITFTYDPAAPPPLDEFVQDARETAEAYERSFRDLLDSHALSPRHAQDLCHTMVRLEEEGRYPDLDSAGLAMARWARSGGSQGEEGTRALLALLSPGRPADTPELMDRLTPDFGLVDTLKASDYLAARLPVLPPGEQAGARERFLRLSGALGEISDAVRLDAILGSLSGPVYDGYLEVCEQLSKSGGERKPKDLLFDFAMLGAYATGPAGLQREAAAFGRLLEPLARAGQADQAAPVYAFLRTRRLSVEAFLQAFQGNVDQALATLDPAPTAPRSTRALEAAPFEPKLGWKAREAVTHLEEQRGRLDESGFERYLATFTKLVHVSGDLDAARRASSVLQSLPVERAEVHLGIVEDFARRRGDGKPEVLEDYLCAVTGRLPGQSLEEGAREYADLLGGCAGAGFPGEAAPTFALIRAGLASGQAGKDTVRTLTERYVKSLLLTKDGEKSRRLLFAADASSTVQEDQSGVTVGGVRIRRRPR